MEKVDKVKELLVQNEYADKIINQPDYRAKWSLVGSATVNIAYSVFKFVIGLLQGSLWIGAIAIYYLLVSILRYLLIFRTHRNSVEQDDAVFKKKMLKSYEVTGWYMLGLNILIMIMGGEMLWVNRTYDLPVEIAVVGAGFTFYCLCNSVYSLVKNRKLQHPLFAATKNISLTCSMLSILSFQTTLIGMLGDWLSPAQRVIANSVTASLVALSIFSIAITMIVCGKYAQYKVLKESVQ